MLKFSLCIPTRERMPQIERLLTSLRRTVSDVNCVEILFAIDNDDIITEAYFKNIKERFPVLNIHYFKRERSDFMNRDYFNWLSTTQAKGDFHWLMGDDVIFVQKDWDKIIIEQVEKYLSTRLDRVVFINIKDDTVTPPDVPKFSCFPLISKEAIEAVGWFMPPCIPTWSADYATYQIYAVPTIDRIFNIDTLFLQHNSIHNAGAEEDNSSQRQRDIYSKYNTRQIVIDYEEQELPVVRGRVIEYINKYSKGRK